MLKSILGMGLCLAMVVGVVAEDNVQKPNKEKKNPNQLVSSNTIIGTTIKDKNNEDVGAIDDIVINKKGKALFAIVGYGGVANVGEDHVAVPCTALKMQCTMKDGEKVVTAQLPMTAKMIEKAPTLQKEEYADLTDEAYCQRLGKFFETDAANAKTGEMLLVSELTDHDVVGSDNESVGHIDDLMFNADHQATFAIIGDGGTLGINEDYTPVPFDALTCSKTEGEWEVSIDKNADQLAKAPKAKAEGGYAKLDNKKFQTSVKESFTK